MNVSIYRDVYKKVDSTRKSVAKDSFEGEELIFENGEYPISLSSDQPQTELSLLFGYTLDGKYKEQTIKVMPKDVDVKTQAKTQSKSETRATSKKELKAKKEAPKRQKYCANKSRRRH